MRAFRSAIEARDFDTVIELLSADVVFRSPVAFREHHGRDAVAPILRAVGQVAEEVSYTHEIGEEAPGRSQALVFRARVGGREVEGCDFVRQDKDGYVDELVVMVRPLTAAIALAEAVNAVVGPVGEPSMTGAPPALEKPSTANRRSDPCR